MPFDVIVVGGGPAGLSAALVLARSRRRIVVFDNGQPRNAAARALHGYLGHDGISPAELLAIGRREIASYGAEYVHEKVVQASCIADAERRFKTGFRVRTAGGRTDEGRKLLIATGVRDVLPDIPGVAECYGISVHHCPYCDGWEHRDKHLLAVGDSAHDAAGLAISLRTWSSRVTAMTEGSPLSNADRKRLTRNGIGICEARIRHLEFESGQLKAAALDSGQSLEADALFFNTDQLMHSDLPLMLGCAHEDKSTVRTGKKQRTDVPGVFLAGDADDDVQFVVVAAAEGARAATAINRELQDEDTVSD
jgi:thioredoxin reductase